MECDYKTTPIEENSRGSVRAIITALLCNGGIAQTRGQREVEILNLPLALSTLLSGIKYC